MLDQYLNAVIQHKPSAVPMTPGYRQTENAIVRLLGQGIWQTAKSDFGANWAGGRDLMIL